MADRTNIKPVYYMCASFEEDRPQIGDTGYFEEWKELERPFPSGVEVLKCERLISFDVDHADALDWDWYSTGGAGGAISQRAKDLVWPHTHGSLRCFQTSINGTPYYILCVNEELAIDCLDRDESVYEVFPHDPTRVMQIKKYVFKQGILFDPLIFHVPESHDILGTRSIRQMALEAGLKGFHFEDVEHLNR